MKLCTWSEGMDGVWDSDCDQAWQSLDGGDPEAHNYIFCPFCGKKIEALPWQDPFDAWDEIVEDADVEMFEEEPFLPFT